MATFYLKVVNPVTASGYSNNINWSQPPYESVPDQMPTNTSAVAFTTSNLTGRFVLWSGTGPSTLSPLNGISSPELTATAGATYVWDMAANTVTKEGAIVPGGPSTQGDTMARLIAWAKANPWKAAAIGFGALYLFGGKKRLL